MHKTFLNEFIICSVTNVTLFNQLFTLDFVKTLFILATQLIITTLVSLTFKYLTNKKQLKK